MATNEEMLERVFTGLRSLFQLWVQQEMRELRNDPKYRQTLIPYGAKVYSQADEDGILREIFRRIGSTNRTFVEIGVGDGLENNTLALLFAGWHGLWIDGCAESIQAIRTGFDRVIEAGQLRVEEARVDCANINRLIAQNISEREIDLLSIDIDGNDYHVMEAIEVVKARAVVIEYNAKFAPPIRYCMPYDPAHQWRYDDCFGVSLQFLEDGLAQKGFRLVGCNLTGTNAFFVRNDLVGDKFAPPFTAERHYEPDRRYLAATVSGHRSSYRTLNQIRELQQPVIEPKSPVEV